MTRTTRTHILSRTLLRLVALALATVTFAVAGAATSADSASAASTTTYRWSGKCVYKWSNGWMKQGCLMRMGGQLYFHDTISPAWYYQYSSRTWWVRLYPTGWMTGADYYRAWGFNNTISASLYRQMCVMGTGRSVC
jgi:hypothetical protein